MEDDAHIDFVRPHLRSNIIVLDTRKVLERKELSYTFDQGKGCVVYGGKRLAHVKSVWYRKPEVINKHDIGGVPEAMRPYSLSGLRHHTMGVWSQFRDAFWLSDYFAVYRASIKPLQLEVAAAAGMRVPDTLATSDEAAARRFIQAHREVIVKSQATVHHSQALFPASRILDPKHVDLRGLHLAPAIFQQAITPVADVRVTVVGEEAFAAAVHDIALEGYPAVRDWRMNHNADKTSFERFKLPSEIRSQCVAIVKKLGLQFDAIDFVMDAQGVLWFLEINPNGQWAFIEDDTGQPIGRSVARLLERDH